MKITPPAEGHRRPQAPAAAGSRVDDIATPALLVDLDALEDNVRVVHQAALEAGVNVRPHAKAHKSPDVARIQLAAGARGICCQKIAEAEVFAEWGVDDILITNEFVGADKARRAANLARMIRLGVCVDHVHQIDQLFGAAKDCGSSIEVLVELDVGQGRCGVGTPEEVVELALRIQECAPSLRFGGIHAFNGRAQHLRPAGDRAGAAKEAAALVREAMRQLGRLNIPCPTITGGGTGTYANDAGSGIYTEVQPGSYVLMDADYAANVLPENTRPLRHVLYGLCTVIHLRPGHAVLDGGLKTFATDHGNPQVLLAGWRVESLSDEHTVLKYAGKAAAPLYLGAKVRLVPGHCDPTVNLHDWLVAVRGESVKAVWPVAARGALL